MNHTALLALEDGSLFYGRSIGSDGETVGEVVFNTAMTGYQEILTDPSYCQQLVTLTHPHIGSAGCNEEDAESTQVQAAGLIIKDLPLCMSNWRGEIALDDYLRAQNVVAIAGIDSRRLTRILREKGAQKGCIIANADGLDAEHAIAQAQGFGGLAGADLAQVVSTQDAYEWQDSVWQLGQGHGRNDTNQFRVYAYDFGVKRNILRLLKDAGCQVMVVPAKTPAAEVLAEKPDGVFFSNGPGDPEPCAYAIESIREIASRKIPMFGICLGHQLLSLASGAKTVKMKFGHHGANHPVQDLKTRQVMITSQNHGFAVDESSLPDNLRATHRSLFDQSLQGVERTDIPAFSFQGHPEASPGPHDIRHLFQRFVELMQQHA